MFSSFARSALVFLLVASLVGVSGVAPGQDPEPERTSDALGGKFESHFFDSDGVRLHYIDEGSGEPVVLIHGFSLGLQIQWVGPGIFSALHEAGYRVIAYDKRGHGASDKPHDPAMYGMPDVADPIRLLDHLGIDRAHVVGYSRGALIAHHLRAEHPDRVRSVVLGGYGEGSEVEDVLGAATRPDLADAMEMEDYRPLLRAVAPEFAPEEIEAWNRQLSEMNNGRALSAAFRADLTLPAINEQELRRNQVPTLAIIGEHDPFRPGAESMGAMMGHLEMFVLPGADHASTISRPEFLTALLGFFRKYGEMSTS